LSSVKKQELDKLKKQMNSIQDSVTDLKLQSNCLTSTLLFLLKAEKPVAAQIEGEIHDLAARFTQGSNEGPSK